MKYSLFFFITLCLLLLLMPVVSNWAQSSQPQSGESRSGAKLELAQAFDLYGESAPEDAACVRLFNASETSGPFKIDLGTTRLKTKGFTDISAYRPVRPDIYQVKIGELQQEVVAGVGKYYTLVYLPDSLIVFDDPAHTDPARAQLFLYNLTYMSNLTLMTADGQTVVVDAVAPRESKDAKVNAMPITFALFQGGDLLQTLPELALKRGQSYSIFVMHEGDGVRAVVVQAVVDAN